MELIMGAERGYPRFDPNAPGLENWRDCGEILIPPHLRHGSSDKYGTVFTLRRSTRERLVNRGGEILMQYEKIEDDGNRPLILSVRGDNKGGSGVEVYRNTTLVTDTQERERILDEIVQW